MVPARTKRSCPSAMAAIAHAARAAASLVEGLVLTLAWQLARRSWGRAETTVRWCRAHGNTAYVVFHGRRDVGVASTDVDVPASEATKASHPRSRGCNAGP